MEQVLENFGVQPILLAAQVVNFLILIFLLKRFLYKPMLKVLESRKENIAESLKKAEEIEKRLVSIESEKAKIFNLAQKESQKMIDQTTKTAGMIIEEAHLKAARDSLKIIETAQKSMSQEREKLYSEIRTELAQMVALGLKKVAGKVLSEKDKKELVEASVKNLKNET